MKKFIVTFQIHSSYSNVNFDLTDLVEDVYESDNVEDLIGMNELDDEIDFSSVYNDDVSDEEASYTCKVVIIRDQSGIEVYRDEDFRGLDEDYEFNKDINDLHSIKNHFEKLLEKLLSSENYKINVGNKIKNIYREIIENLKNDIEIKDKKFSKTEKTSTAPLYDEKKNKLFDRPYISSSIVELENIFEDSKNNNDFKTLNILLNELVNRNTQKAVLLRENVKYIIESVDGDHDFDVF